MKNKEYVSFTKMIEYIDKTIKYVNGYDFKQFCDDEKTVDATIFAISQIGELVKSLIQCSYKTFLVSQNLTKTNYLFFVGGFAMICNFNRRLATCNAL